MSDCFEDLIDTDEGLYFHLLMMADDPGIVATISRILQESSMSTLFKNVASQKWRVFAINTETGTPVTGDAANISATIRKGNGSPVATNDVHPNELAAGYYDFDLTQAETNANRLDLIPVSSTPNVFVIPLPASQLTTPAGLPDLEINDGAVAAAIAEATQLVPWCTCKLSSTLGESVFLDVWAHNGRFGWIDISDLDEEATAFITIRENGSGEDVVLLTRNFTAEELVSGKFKATIDDPGFEANKLYEVLITITADGVTYSNQIPLDVGP
ncbi:hypothetical protein SH661x_000431 [Planctomicrobium sp. SH661]|uniref:hypothetical protein n=1 Tax=Planctomicrobium sp. SH661 TaxID=3448124 RepID=UPI003F5B7BB3